jgi:hypothetical protein
MGGTCSMHGIGSGSAQSVSLNTYKEEATGKTLAYTGK